MVFGKSFCMKSISRQILVLLLALPGFATGQQTTVTDTAEYNKTHSKKVYFGSVVVHDGDTMAGFYLPSVMVRDKMVFKNARDERKWRKLIRDIKKDYPYAKIAGAKLRQCEAKLALPENQGRKKELMKQAEKEIKGVSRSKVHAFKGYGKYKSSNNAERGESNNSY